MSRAWPVLLLLAAAVARPAAADDDAGAAVQASVRAHLDAGRPAEALAEAEAWLDDHPDDGTLRYLRAQAHVAIARERQRTAGYDAALEYLEQRLDHARIAWAYGRTCLWAGRERRGVRVLRESDLPVEDRLPPQLELLAQLRRYDEILERVPALREYDAEYARAWLGWAREEQERRARLDGYTRRAGWAAAVGLLLYAGGAAGVLVLTRPRRRPGAPS